MKTEKFNYDLPEHLIAQYPLENRVDSKLLACIAGIEHKNFHDVLSYMDHGDLLVVNKTSVIPARLFGEKNTGGKVEIFLERFLSDFQTLAQIKSSRTPKELTKKDTRLCTLILKKENLSLRPLQECILTISY